MSDNRKKKRGCCGSSSHGAITPIKEGEFEGSIYRARFLYSCEMEYCAMTDDFGVAKGDFVVMDTRYGKDLVQILGKVDDLSTVAADSLRMVERVATEADIAKREHYEEREEEAFQVCKEKISKHRLDMKLVTAHYLLDEAKVMFFFTADTRIDFRELVKDLVSVFRMRIELRQIGVRDEARFLGGMAVCGRNFCCHGVMDYLKPVSIKMAKEQNLSLNSLKISGPCGRLLCCLSYEFDYYDTEKKLYPPEGYKLRIRDTGFKVINVNIFSKRVTIAGPEGLRVDLAPGDFKKSDGRWTVTKKIEI